MAMLSTIPISQHTRTLPIVWVLALVAFKLLVAVVPAHAQDCSSTAMEYSPIQFLSGVSSSIKGADVSEIERSLNTRLLDSRSYQILSDEQFHVVVQKGELDACAPAFGVNVNLRQENSDPGAAMGLGGLVARTTFVADVTVGQEPQTNVIERFSLTEKVDGLFSASSSSKGFRRLIDKIAPELESRKRNFLTAWAPAIARPIANRTSDAEDAGAGVKGTYVPVIHEFRTFDGALETTMQTSYSADLGPAMAANLMTAMRPDLRGISACMQQRLDVVEERDTARGMRLLTAMYESKAAGKKPDLTAIAFKIYGTRNEAEIAPKMQRDAILFTSNVEYCTNQLRIRKAKGY